MSRKRDQGLLSFFCDPGLGIPHAEMWPEMNTMTVPVILAAAVCLLVAIFGDGSSSSTRSHSFQATNAIESSRDEPELRAVLQRVAATIAYQRDIRHHPEKWPPVIAITSDALKITASKDVVIPVERVILAGSPVSIVNILADNRVEVECDGVRGIVHRDQTDLDAQLAVQFSAEKGDNAR
jgi:hypothetical protein